MRRNIREADIVIIDEISMVSATTFETVEAVCRYRIYDLSLGSYEDMFDLEIINLYMYIGLSFHKTQTVFTSCSQFVSWKEK
jgi:hypothetical protein